LKTNTHRNTAKQVTFTTNVRTFYLIFSWVITTSWVPLETVFASQRLTKFHEKIWNSRSEASSELFLGKKCDNHETKKYVQVQKKIEKIEK